MSQETDLKTTLQQLDDYDFEHLIADLWADQGWETRVLQASNDQGIDVEARRFDPFEQKHLIQAKRYAEGNNVGSQAIQQYASLRHQEDNVDVVIVVPTSAFTPQAKEIAGNLNLKLLDGDDLAQMIENEDALHLVNKYSSEPTASANNSPTTDRSSSSQSLQTVDSNKVPEIYITKLVDNVRGKLVTKNRLTKLKPGITHQQTLTEKPILEHLYKDEQPHFTFHCTKVRLPGQEAFKPANNAYLVATNQRVLILIGEEYEDIEITIPYRQINDVQSGRFNKVKLELATEVGQFRFIITHMVFNDNQIFEKEDIYKDIENCIRYITDAAYSVM